ncbi:FtsX-like permease family protein, partial [Pyxidicoccus sp. 3LFB2]
HRHAAQRSGPGHRGVAGGGRTAGRAGGKWRRRCCCCSRCCCRPSWRWSPPATLLLLARERVAEVGTLRAVGMQRREVFTSLLLEGLLLGGLGSLLGAVLGATLLRLGMGDGVAVEDGSLQFFLGGPVLRPELAPGGTGVVVLGVTLVVVVAALVPAWRGSAVAPVAAMRKGEG